MASPSKRARGHAAAGQPPPTHVQVMFCHYPCASGSKRCRRVGVRVPGCHMHGSAVPFKQHTPHTHTPQRTHIMRSRHSRCS